MLTNRKRKSQDSMKVLSKKARFYSNYRRQSWSLPESIIYYIIKNPSTSKVYQKMVQCCKYFYIKNSIVVVEHLYFSYGFWKASNYKEIFAVRDIIPKMWVTYLFDVVTSGKHDEISSIYPKLYRCDVKCLYLRTQTISFDKFLFLSSNVKSVRFNNVIVRKDDDSIVPLEKLVEAVPKATVIEFYGNHNDTGAQNISSSTVKNLLKIPHFSLLQELSIENVPEVLDIETFYDSMKTNTLTQISLTFIDSISDVYKNRLKKIVDAILQAKPLDYKSPSIYFDGIDDKKYWKLYRLCDNIIVD